jgi:alkanesulfonate monooxygenase SsuD/methylene tetrahydromethanopterin reductase-like flavin-dependent oxidoreductase (luciferase family)
MLTSFGALYAGYIDMENVGYEGTPANDRWYANDRLCEVFDNARAMAQLVEKHGYDVFWTAEHHFQREGYECIPNVLLLNVYLASAYMFLASTENARAMTGVIVHVDAGSSLRMPSRS